MNEIATRNTNLAATDRTPARRVPKVVDGEVVERKPFLTPARIAAIALAIPGLVAGFQGVGM
jgi:hypothetical protein